MRLSDGAPAHGLIRRATPVRSRGESRRRETRDYSDRIWLFAARECKTHDDLWLQRNPAGCAYVRKRAHRIFLTDFAGFYICITERLLRSCLFERPVEFMDAVADEVREAALRDPWRLHPPHVISDGEYIRAAQSHNRINFMRTVYGDPSARPADELIREVAHMAAWRFVAGSRASEGVESVASVFAEGLDWMSRRFLANAAFRGLSSKEEVLFLPA